MKRIMKHLPNIVRAGLEGEKRTVELATYSIIKQIKKDDPVVAEILAEILADYGAGAPLTRSLGVNPPPVDKDNFLSLVTIHDNQEAEHEIVLSKGVSDIFERFVKERNLMKKLIANGVKPPNSILMHGAPGVGKTFVTSVLSKKLELPLITLDLSSTISSYLGKTGQNLKKVLEYAKSTPSILFLDEFDAIAKKRDDPTDLGELKRIVNVLLKELEEWPNHSIVVAATNHPEMLDEAIWRRFDLKVEIPLPDEHERYKLWELYLDNEIVRIKEEYLKVLSKFVDKISPADIKQMSQQVLRAVIVDEIDPEKLLIDIILEKAESNNSADFNFKMIKLLYENFGNKMSQAKIARLLNLSPSTVNYHISKVKNGDEANE